MNLEQLKKKHQELGEEIKKLEKKEKKPWRAEFCEEYYYGYCTKIEHGPEYNNSFDDYNYLIGNYFKTKEEAEKYLERQKAIGRVTHAIYALQGDWKPNWEDDCRWKYYIVYYVSHKEFGVDISNEIKRNANLPYLQSEEIAEQIIKDHEEDLRIIFEV